MRALLPTELFILAMMYISNCTLLSSNTVIYVCLYVFCRVAHIRTYLISYSTSMACSHQWPEAIKSASQRFDLHHDFTMNQSHIIQYIPLLPSTPRADLVILSVHSRLFLTIIALSQLSSPCVPAFTCVPLIHLLINKNKDSTALDLEKKKKKKTKIGSKKCRQHWKVINRLNPLLDYLSSPLLSCLCLPIISSALGFRHFLPCMEVLPT